MGSRNFGEPIQILKLNPRNRKYELNDSQLEEILQDPNLENVELSVVSIAGAFRKGKSFLLSFFLRFLMFYYDNDNGEQKSNTDWLNDKNSRLSGFSWRSGCDAHTTGIWMWSKIFTKTMPNGQRIGIILLDTQGMFDNKTDMNSNVTIFALSTMLSSIQIYNIFNNIQEDDLQHLQLFTEYGRIAMENQEGDSKPFQQIMFLVRDWNYPTQYSYGLMSGNRFLNEKVLKINPESPQGIKTVREHLRSCFDEASCFLMPHPGDKVRTNENFDGRLTDINPEFVKHLNELVSYLLKPTNISRTGLKKINGSKITAREFYNLIQQFWKVFKSGKIPEAKSILEATTEALCLSVESEITHWYYQQMTNFAQANDVDFPQLINSHKNLMEYAVQKYNDRVVMGDEQTRRYYLQEMQKKMQEHLTYFLGMHQSKKSKSFEETIARLSNEMAELRIRDLQNQEFLLIEHSKIQEFMKITQQQQLERIRGMEKNILNTMKQNNAPAPPRKKGFCSIM